jgi:hypothetical protein
MSVLCADPFDEALSAVLFMLERISLGEEVERDEVASVVDQAEQALALAEER